MKEAGKCYRLAIATGGKREQVEFALHGTPIENDFAVLVSCEDTTIGKPDPSIYRLALKLINGVEPWPRPLIQPEECLVIEDTPAGMKVVALATAYPAEELAAAHLVIRNAGKLPLGRVHGLFPPRK